MSEPNRRRVRRNRNQASSDVDASNSDNLRASGEEKGGERGSAVGESKEGGLLDDKETKRGGVTFEDGQAAGGSTKPAIVTPRPNSPKKNKPPKTPPTSSREDDKDNVDRSRGKALSDTIYNSLLKSWPLAVGAGYRLGLQSKGSAIQDSILGPGDEQRHLCTCISALRMDTTSMVRPAIRIHAVYKDSGK